jgi:TolA-binding protein
VSVLDSALKALREETRTPHGSGDLTLRRILAQTDHRRHHKVALVVALSFAVVASGALAGVHWAARHGSPGRALVKPEEARNEAAPPSIAPVPVTAQAPSVQQPPRPQATRISEPHRRATARAGPEARRVRDPFSEEDGLFEQAQRVHVDSPGSAEDLAGWDQYLKKYPQGRFEPVARYRRAISLAGQQRWSDARTAFEPFSDGAFGDYRQQEAAAWLRSMPEQ